MIDITLHKSPLEGGPLEIRASFGDAKTAVHVFPGAHPRVVAAILEELAARIRHMACECPPALRRTSKHPDGSAYIYCEECGRLHGEPDPATDPTNVAPAVLEALSKLGTNRP